MNRKNIRCILSGSTFLTACLFFNLFCSSAALSGEKADILTIGEARIKGNNLAEAKNEAISDALKKGMEEYLSGYLGSLGMISNFSLLINNVTTIAGEEIENFHILAEEKKDEKYSILVRVKVNEKLMEQRLREMGVVSIEATSLKVLFLVSEEKVPGKGISFWWEKPDSNPAMTTTELKLYNLFLEQGLQPVNRLLSSYGEKYSENMKKLELSKEDAIEWGRIFSADIIIKGKSLVSADNKVVVDLEAINVADGSSISHASQTEPMNSLEAGETRFMTSLETAINSIAIQIGPDLIKSFRKNNGEANSIYITLKDINNFEEFRLFKKFLEEDIGGIKSVTQSKVKWRTVCLLVEFFGTKDLFISKIKNRNKLPFQGDVIIEGGDLIIKIEHELFEPITSNDGTSR
jgi:hypothetical protein